MEVSDADRRKEWSTNQSGMTQTVGTDADIIGVPRSVLAAACHIIRNSEHAESETAKAMRKYALSTQAAELDALRGEVERTLSDTQRLIWRDDVEGICPSLDLCFDYGGTVRCAPCAIKQSQARGVEPNMGLPNLPEVSRLRRKCTDYEAIIAQLCDRVAKFAEILETVLPYTEAERLREEADVRCGRTYRNPIQKAVNKARALLTQNEVG